MAEIKYLTNVDLSKNQILNAVIQNLATAPSTPVAGQIYYNTADGNIYIWDGIGAAWVDLTSQGSGSTNLTTTANGTTVTVVSSTGTDGIIGAATITVAGVMTAADKTKLDGIATGAEVNVDTNIAQGTRTTTTVPVTSSTGTDATLDAATTTLAGVMTSADKTKLDGITAGANVNVDTDITVTQVGDVVTVLSSDGTDDTIAVGTQTNAGVLSTADKIKLDAITGTSTGSNTGDVTLNADTTTQETLNLAAQELQVNKATTSTDGAMSAEDKTKLDGIEPLADVTDATNVNAAGAVMNSDTTTAAMNFVIDEDTMVSDSATKVPTQQSVKAYVDAQVVGGMTYQGEYNAATNTPDLESGTGVLVGDTYTVTADGAFFAENVQVGDVVVAEVDGASTLAGWTVVNKNIPTIVDASTTAKGIIELATQTEVNTGTDTVRAVTPATLKGTLGVTGTLSTVLKYTQLIGNGALTSIVITHSIGDINVQSQVFDASTGDLVVCEIENTSTNTTTFKFNIAPTANQYRVVIIG
jgi:hypothetical protein